MDIHLNTNIIITAVCMMEKHLLITLTFVDTIIKNLDDLSKSMAHKEKKAVH